ncbi:amino acid ABC transporter ATP-binding protein [Saxibacter everestensis]|uniref:Amino acid ABC transporter ATP-binding protein n=1 Tax=Saxibacter everestensis TaxID=2909229 RepID=A0ABY8QYB7_9MICO|nr:amino acid ABC transporter ATP-binding protein [Brevibacteriaceae bacterium ZFBP1038]
MNAFIQLRNVHKSFGHVEVLKGAELEVNSGEVLCLLGRSGSGKSTLLRCINQLESIDEGAIHVGGELLGAQWHRGKLRALKDSQITAQRREIGMVFQQFNLFPHLSILENVIEAPIRVLGLSSAKAKQRATDLLEQVGLGDKQASYPNQLSGGQQQRAAIARALAMRPKVMLFDEPTSALDPELVGEVLEVMQGLAASGMTMIVVTHEFGFAREAADIVAYMHDGTIIEKGSPEIVLATPADERTRAFISAVK